jgi:hypothetical protein
MSVQDRTSAIQNEIVRLYFTFEYNGSLANPSGQPLVEILDADGVTILDNLNAQLESTGIFYVDWYVPADLPLGNYYDRWTYQWATPSGVTESVMTFSVHSLESYINFISPGTSHSVSERVVQLSMDLANEFIYECMHIPIYWEQGLRIQQENQQKRIKTYYYFTLDQDVYNVEKNAIYFHNNQKYTVFQDLHPIASSSSSNSSSSESIDNVSTSSSSSSSNKSISSESSSSSTNSSSSSYSSSSSESLGNNSTSSSSVLYPTTTTTTTEWIYKPILMMVGTGDPLNSGTLTKMSGTGPTTINFVSWQKKVSRFSTIYNVAYKNWNKEPRPLVRQNNRIIDDGWFTDYNGYVYMDGIFAPEDSINVSYNFAYFSKEEILSFLRIGLKVMNALPPVSTYSSLDMMPREWDAIVLIFAAITALRRLIFGLNWQEKYVIFSRPDALDATNQVIQNLKDLLTGYVELWNELSKGAKKKLPSIAQFVMPEYTLPGGRSRFFRYLYKSSAGA